MTTANSNGGRSYVPSVQLAAAPALSKDATDDQREAFLSIRHLIYIRCSGMVMMPSVKVDDKTNWASIPVGGTLSGDQRPLPVSDPKTDQWLRDKLIESHAALIAEFGG